MWCDLWRLQLASIQVLWQLEQRNTQTDRLNFKNCGDAEIEHWLHCQDLLFDDLKHIKHRVAFHFETFAFGDTQGWHGLLGADLS